MWGRVHMYIRLPGRKILITPERPLHKKWIKDFFSKCDQLRIWSHLLKKFLMENVMYRAVGIEFSHETLAIFSYKTFCQPEVQIKKYLRMIKL